jgi:Cys-Gly metallodipeptidase DUG1
MTDTVLPRALYECLDYSIADIEASAGAPIALSDDKIQVLMGRMRQPSLSIHGIEGAFYGAGAKTVIPAKVTGKFSIRSVASVPSLWTMVMIFSRWKVGASPNAG